MKLIIFVFLIINFAQLIRSQNVTDFICTNGTPITLEKLCDGVKNCPDGSDETKSTCQRTLCPIGTYRCYYGACISKRLQCDGTPHCADGSDETKCGRKPESCNENEFRCSSGKCIAITKLCDGKNDCEKNSDEGDICEKISVCPRNTHRCRVGGCIYLEQRCDGHKDCIDGSDESDEFCNVLNCVGPGCHEKSDKIRCTIAISPRISAQCEVPDGPHKGIIPCSVPLPIGTIMRYECKAYFVPASDNHKDNNEMICQPDGTWSRDYLRCIPDCGHANPAVAPLIVNGWISKSSGFAWHAVLFALNGGNWTFICGGTLITEKIVITAAHCTWKTKPHLLQVGLGKRYSDYYRTEENAQIRNISKIIQQPLYQDILGNYGSDIAILVLSEHVDFSPVIKPACIDWMLDDISDHLKENAMGLVVGMGVTENDTFSEQLRGTYLPVIDDKTCIKRQKRDFKKYITFTSFCAGWSNGTGVCNGDSGGGLVFPLDKDSNRFTLQGIVSVSPRRPGTSLCDPSYYTVFTKVGIYVEWIYKVLQEIHDDVKYTNANVIF